MEDVRSLVTGSGTLSLANSMLPTTENLSNITNSEQSYDFLSNYRQPTILNRVKKSILNSFLYQGALQTPSANDMRTISHANLYSRLETSSRQYDQRTVASHSRIFLFLAQTFVNCHLMGRRQ